MRQHYFSTTRTLTKFSYYYAKAYVAVVLTVAAQASYARARVYAFV